MRVFVTGATGFIGSHIVRALRAGKHSVTLCARDTGRCGVQHPGMPSVSCDFTRDITPSAWLPRLKGIDVVINAVGIITESGRDRFESVHVKGTRALFDACRDAGIAQVIHISALGVSPDSSTAYNRTKREADEYLLSLKSPAVVLRPSWLYGNGSQSFEVLCAFSTLPAIPVTGNGDYMIQPIDIHDFADAVCRLVGDHTLDGQVVEAGGPEKIAIREVHSRLRHWLALPPVSFWRMPEGFVKRFVKLGDYFLKGPVNSASFDMLTRHNVTDDARLWRATGVEPSPFLQSPSFSPSTRAQQQYAAFFFLLPLLRISLAVVWIASALITGFLTPRMESLTLLFEAGITGLPADIVMFYASIGLDFLLGLTLLFNWRPRLFGLIQIALILFYTLFITFGAPHWWLHPYGPLIKNIPLIPATLMIMAAGKR